MKELYTSPEAKVVSFASDAKIATDPFALTLGGDVHTSKEPEGGGSDF